MSFTLAMSSSVSSFSSSLAFAFATSASLANNAARLSGGVHGWMVSDRCRDLRHDHGDRPGPRQRAIGLLNRVRGCVREFESLHTRRTSEPHAAREAYSPRSFGVGEDVFHDLFVRGV